MLGFWDAAASAGPYANNLHSLQTDNHSNTSSLNFYRLDALPDAQPTENERVPIQLAQCRFPGLAIFNGTLLWNFVHNSGMRKISPRQVDRIVDTTVRRSSLWITPTTVDASLLDARSLLHVGRLLPSYSVIHSGMQWCGKAAERRSGKDFGAGTALRQISLATGGTLTLKRSGKSRRTR